VAIFFDLSKTGIFRVSILLVVIKDVDLCGKLSPDLSILDWIVASRLIYLWL